MTGQQATIKKLEKKGWEWKYRSEEWRFEVLSKRKNRMIMQVEVDEEGLCNGLPLTDYLEEAQ